MSEVRAFFDRWQRLEKAKAEISDDLKELFAEAKATGFNTKAMRVAFRAKVKAENETDDDRELAAIVDLYLAEIDGARAHPASARVEKIEEFPAGETGMVLGTGKERPLSIGLHTDGDPEARFETASLHQFQAKASEDNGATGRADTEVPSDSMAGEASRLASGRTDAGEAAAADLPTNSNPPNESSTASADSPAPTSSLASGTNSDEGIPAFLRKPKTAADYRPHCLHPEACGSSGLHRCYSCEKALERESEAA